jgi:hypothetical protein
MLCGRTVSSEDWTRDCVEGAVWVGRALWVYGRDVGSVKESLALIRDPILDTWQVDLLEVIPYHLRILGLVAELNRTRPDVRCLIVELLHWYRMDSKSCRVAP